VEPEVLRPWVARETGSEVARFERIGAGASRATWLASLVGGGEVVVRAETGAGPLAQTELSLAREARVYDALGNGPAAIPNLLAEHPSGEALLLERAPGSDAFSALTGAARQQVAEAYARQLAVLHGLDPGKLELPGFPRPAMEEESAGFELALWRRVADQRVPELAPAVELAFDWLAAHPAPGPVHTVLCHGDAGPGNFLFENGSVTALLDWEFAHFGDPHDDLAWVVVRAQLLGGFGDLREVLRTWRNSGGFSLTAGKLEHFRALVLLRMAVACQAGLALARDGAMDTTIYGLLLPYLSQLLPAALERAGCTDASLPELARLGDAAVAAVPVLAGHVHPLDALELP
jgi:aminoglycoside phosphotransferase (APT) family kinase protein